MSIALCTAKIHGLARVSLLFRHDDTVILGIGKDSAVGCAIRPLDR